LRIILELLKKEKLYAKFSNCDFWIRIVKFLGHLINSQGLHVNPTKIEAVKNWASSTTPTEGEDQELAFQQLKQKLCEALILALPEGNDDFVVYCDAYHQAFVIFLLLDFMTLTFEEDINSEVRKLCKLSFLDFFKSWSVSMCLSMDSLSMNNIVFSKLSAINGFDMSLP
ncbi:putative reverse transcriptase domain-containing protein, partial [Tanacetum coccineum]